MPVTSAASAIKAGTVTHFAASTAPAGWLKANGATVSRTTYAALFAAIGTTYGAGDGSTTFAVPDLRGEFIRGFDDGRGVDTARAIGSAQAADIAPHTHTYNNTTNSGGNTGGGSGTVAAFVGSTATGSAGTTETRPRNVAMLACIKY